MSYQNYYQPVIPAQMQAELAVYQQKQIISANVKISEEAAKANINGRDKSILSIGRPKSIIAWTQ